MADEQMPGEILLADVPSLRVHARVQRLADSGVVVVGQAVRLPSLVGQPDHLWRRAPSRPCCCEIGSPAS